MSLGFVGHILGTGLGMVWCLLNFDVKRCLFFFGFVGLPPPVVAEIRERFKMHPETKKRFTW